MRIIINKASLKDAAIIALVLNRDSKKLNGLVAKHWKGKKPKKSDFLDLLEQKLNAIKSNSKNTKKGTK